MSQAPGRLRSRPGLLSGEVGERCDRCCGTPGPRAGRLRARFVEAVIAAYEGAQSLG